MTDTSTTFAPATFDAFWLHYLRAHSKPGTRITHYLSILIATIVGLYGIFTLNIWLVLASVAIGYFPSVISHSVIEKNEPLIKENALWAAISGIRMFFLGISGMLGGELKRAGVKK